MSKAKAEKIENGDAVRSSKAAEIANTLEWLATAFILAFVFRAFVMEAYRIPTGSMADTLMGDHYRLRCTQCGYRYNHGFVPEKYRLTQNALPGKIPTFECRCPSCGYYQAVGGGMAIANGDRILVLKCIYQFFEPQQWDVVVFKNPLEPQINYIKRLVGRPGESVEIIDGDIYVNGQLNRKPPKVQNELWMPVYDNDYQPARPREGSFNGHIWKQPFRNIAGSKWKVDESNPTVFRLDSSPEEINRLFYDTYSGNDFRATYAYGDVSEYEYMPYCSDLMVRFYVKSGNDKGRVGAALSKYQNKYIGWVDFSGNMVIEKMLGEKKTVELASKAIDLTSEGKAALVKFANVDHQLVLEFGDEELIYDLGRGPEDAGRRLDDIQPEVKIFGSGNLRLSHIAVFRDIHYTSRRFANSGRFGRATEGNPLRLSKDEFFVLGDNSPDSADGRWWNMPGKGNSGLMYREGIVPREYLVGKAMFVYWPSGFKPFAKSRIAFIPNIGQMRFVYGGSSKNN